MIIFPNAKINLGLNVISRRNDGYHNIETILYPVQIKEALEIVEADQLQFTASGIPIPGRADDNLCLKAWHLIAKDVHLPKVHIHLHKNIPVGAGLGGGSADAAFFIRLLNDKFNLGFTISRMEDYARQLGSDCAFFINNQPVLATGKGDEFKSLDLKLDKYFLVLVMPPIHVSTAEAYHGVQALPQKQSLVDLIGLPIEMWRNSIHNGFEGPVFEKYPVIKNAKDALYQSGALYASMSGSGASLYGIFEKSITLPNLEKDHIVFYDI